ncbi:hypothetical protein [Streptomyces sp. NBC_00996]|uniref:hypothetical protein n=1 Tax=Streptomyces sp. NBC_00996 TaxID=2903710 RepID=UPI00386AB222|nr:hypothetical protein OG390_26620 [Streptomyces sp. NBC_00996]
MSDDEFARVLETVLRDLRAQCSVQPDVREPEDDYPGLMLHAPDGSGQGVYWGPDDRPGVRLAEVADQVQEWAVEALWTEGESAVWPRCPAHPDSHPSAATVVEGVAVWVCPKTGVSVSRIGELPPLGDTVRTP